MKHIIRWLVGLALMVTLGFGASHADPRPLIDASPADTAALNDATAAACGKNIVVLGEVGTHGDGHAIAFKAALASRLVAQCGFSAVMWESSFYEFDHLNQLVGDGVPITREQVAAAIGGIWNRDAALQPFFDELTRDANRHKIILGGFDDIWDMAGVPYTTDDLPRALAKRLPSPEADTCANAFHDRIYNGYAPGDVPRHQQLISCLDHIRTAVPLSDRHDLDLLDSLRRYIDDDLLPQGANGPSEHSMYLNLRVLIDRLPPQSKVIVWTATIHGGRETSAPDGAPIERMGGYIHDAFGKRSLIIAMGAAGGNYGQAFTEKAYPIPLLAAESIEAQSIAGTSAPAVYVTPERLEAFGTAPAGLFFHEPPITRDWSQTVDAAVIFRDEVPAKHVPDVAAHPQ